MKRFSITCLMILVFSWMTSAPAQARYNPSWTWQTIQNDHFIVYYPAGHEDTAARIMSLSDEVYKDISGYLGIHPDLCPVVVNPGTDLFNGFYTPFPNRISLYETPFYSLRGFGPVSDSMDAVFTHEYSHFAHITTRLGWYGSLSRLFGSDSAISNILSPGWLIEGITTNTETLFTDGGRGRCSYFKGKILSFSEGEGLWNLSAAGTSPPYQPPGDRFYLAGYHMVEYLTRTYGDDAFARLSRYQAEHPLGLSAEALRHVTGKYPDQFYWEFLEDFNAQAKAFKDRAQSEDLPRGQVLLSGDMADIQDHFWTSRDTIMAFKTDYTRKNELIEIDPFTGNVIRTMKPGRVNSLDRLSGMKDGTRLVYAGYYPHLFGQGDLVDTDITVFDTASGDFERVTRGAHIFSADISNDKSRFVATRRNGMWIDLVLMDFDGSNIRPLISKPGYMFECPRWSEDDSVIVSVVKTGGNADIALIDPKTGDIRTLFEPDRFEDNDPVFSPDGNWVAFSSNRSGTWNIYAWSIREHQLFQLTADNYGATMPRISPDGKTFSYESLERGTRRLCVLPFKPLSGRIHPVAKGGSPVPPDLTRLCPAFKDTPRGIPYGSAYKPFLHIPYLMSDEDDTRAGIWVMGADPLNLNSYSAFINYGFDSEHVGYDLSWTNRSFWPALTLRAYDKANVVTDGTDDFWYKERAVEGSVSLDMINRVVPDEIVSQVTAGPRFKWFDKIDENVGFPLGNKAFSVFAEAIVQRSPDAPKRDMLPTWGQTVFAMYERTIDGLGSELDGKNAVLSVSQYLPSFFKHHGIELKSVIQKQWGDFGFDKDYSLPRGYSSSDPEGGMNLSKNLLFSAEYHFPISYPDRGFGLSVFHINLVKSTVFADVGAGWDRAFDADQWKEKAKTVVGGSLRTENTLFSMLPLELGLEMGYKIDDEEGFANLILLFPF